jgi:hypothetical protein
MLEARSRVSRWAPSSGSPARPARRRTASFLAVALALGCVALATAGCLAADEYWLFGLTRSFQEGVVKDNWLLEGNPLTEVVIVFFVVGDLVFFPVAFIHDVALLVSTPVRWRSRPDEDAALGRRRPGTTRF